LISGVIFKNELLEARADSIHVHFVVSADLSGCVVKIVAVELGVAFVSALLDLLEGGLFSDVEVDELVGHDSEALESKSLNLCAGESSDDPALVSLLSAVNFTFHESDHDIVVDHFVLLEAVGDTLAIFALLSLLAGEAVSNRNVTPLEVVSNGHRILGLAGAGHTHKENSVGLLV